MNKRAAPVYQPGMKIKIHGDKRTWLVPGEHDFPEKCNWSPAECITCRAQSRRLRQDSEDCTEYVLMELDQFGLPTGQITTHVCEKMMKLAK